MKFKVDYYRTNVKLIIQIIHTSSYIYKLHCICNKSRSLSASNFFGY